MIHALKGRKQSKEHIKKRVEKIRKALTGRKLSKSTRAKMRKSAHRGENHYNWKGNKVGYDALHDWIKNHKPKPKFCEKCKINSPTELANISGKYKRDVNDFEWLCRSCHIEKDKLREKASKNMKKFNELPRTKKHIENWKKSRWGDRK